MIGQPFPDLGMLVGSVVVEDGMDDLPNRHGALHRIEKGDKLLMPVLVHASPEHGAVQDIERGEQCRNACLISTSEIRSGCAVALVIMGHGGAFARLQRQARLSAVERLDLALLVDGQHDGVAGWGHIQADHILDLLGKGRIARHLEGAQAMRLKPVRFPDPLHGPQTDTDRLGDSASGPMRGGARRFRTGKRKHFGDRLRRCLARHSAAASAIPPDG
jgi:hypothetical protein